MPKMLRPTLMLFDIDDTLLVADAHIILRDRATNSIRHRLTTEAFREWKKTYRTQEYLLDFTEFVSVEEVTRSFLRSSPGPGLSILRDAVEDPNIEIGILTARSGEAAVRVALPRYLLEQDIHIHLDPDLIFAINDPKYQNFSENMNDSERKLEVILNLMKERIFDRILLVDDDLMHKRIIESYCKAHKILNVSVCSV